MSKTKQTRRAARVFAPSTRDTGNRFGSQWIVECRICGFEPDDQLSLPRAHCPKCHASAWHRVPRPGCILAACLNDARPRLVTIAARSPGILAQNTF